MRSRSPAHVRRPSVRLACATALTALLAGAGLTGCTGATGPSPTSTPSRPSQVVIASFNFPESSILAELYGQTLQAGGVPVRYQLDLGARELVMPALIRGLVDVVPEYSGAALEFLDGGSGLAVPNEDATYDHLVRQLASRRLTALAPSPAQDQDAFAVTRETASRLGVRSISDLAATSGDLTLGGPPECPDRPLCLVGLERTYGLRFRDFVPLDSAATVSNALASGAVDVGVLFSTDGTIRQRHLVALADDRHLQPADNVVPILRDATLARLDAGVRRSLDRVSRALTTIDLRLLNARVEFEGSSPAEVANDWLTSHELPAPKATTAG